MDNLYRRLKGKTISDVYEKDGGIYLMLKSGTRIELGYETEVIPPSCRDCKKRMTVTRETTTYLVCDKCMAKREEDKRAREARLRELAYKDTPALAALRSQLET